MLKKAIKGLSSLIMRLSGPTLLLKFLRKAKIYNLRILNWNYVVSLFSSWNECSWLNNRNVVYCELTCLVV